MRRKLSGHNGFLGVLLGSVTLALTLWCTPALANETVWACGTSYGSGVFAGSAAADMIATSNCPAYPQSGGGLVLRSGLGNIARGDTARFQANAPTGLQIVSAAVPSMIVSNVNDDAGYGGGFYWQGGGTGVANNQTAALVGPFASSPYFGFQLICGVNHCDTSPGASIQVGEIALGVHETIAPTLVAPVGLWASSGWVRGHWRVYGWGNSPSGLCSLSAVLNGTQVGETSSAQIVSSWHQCQAPPVDQTIDTSTYGQGALRLTLNADDAAGESASVSKTVYVDNQQPTVSLSGPSDAPSTAGTQYVTATAGAGPSGVAGISCAVDGGPAQWYAGRSARVPVNGVGQHVVRCSSQNNAVGPHGNHGTSAVQAFSIKIGAPTVTAIAFSKIVDQLSCHQARETVRVPARWVTTHRRHRLVRVRERAHAKLVEVTRCHARTVRRQRTVSVTVSRHGRRVRVQRRRTVRVILLPHALESTSRWVSHGRATSVSGWLGTYNGVALAGQAVEVLAAADNGREQFRPVAMATTASDGSWRARLPAGPSRLVEAAFGGGPAVQPSLSGLVHEIVPAEVKLLSVSPHRVAWGGTVRLVGQLRGGYLPSDGALVRLRIGLGSTFTTYGVHEHVGGDGRFSTSYTFGAGDPSAYRSFWFQVASLPMGNYPYAPASSRRLIVQVGGHPRPPQRRASQTK